MKRMIIQYLYRVIYVTGILIIILLSIVKLVQLEPTVNNNPLVNESQIQTGESSDSLLNLVIKPVVDSQRNQIIFEGIFFFILWILFFILLPVGLLPLNRFKMFNMEFEIGEREAAAIERISQNSSKALTMVNYSSEESIIRYFREFNDKVEVQYKDALEFFFKDLVKGYREEFNIHMNYKIYEMDELPKKFRSLCKESRDTKEAVVLNKLENDNPLHSNWLITAYLEESLVTVFTSRLTPFDAMDRYLITFLHNLAYRIFENRNYAMALDELTRDDEDGQVI